MNIRFVLFGHILVKVSVLFVVCVRDLQKFKCFEVYNVPDMAISLRYGFL